MEGYFASALEMELAKNLLVQPCSVIPNHHQQQQQHYYEYPNSSSNGYLAAPPAYPISTQTIYNEFYDANQFNYEAPKHNHIANSQAPLYSTAFQPNSIATWGLPLESSVFLSPQASSPSSSAAQSPHAEASLLNEALDLPLDEIFSNIDDPLGDELTFPDELLDVLKDVDCRDYLSKLETSSDGQEFCFHSDLSSVEPNCATPKRKYSSDSSGCYSVESFESTNSSGSDTTTTTTDIGAKQTKRTRRAKPNPAEKVARKKDQNKKAASRYRNKKKTEVQSCEQTMEELEGHRDSLTEQLKKLQTEFSVILPLARAAFTFDPVRSQQLSQLITRVDALL